LLLPLRFELGLSGAEGQVFLEAVMLEMRAGDGAAAVRAAWRALQVHRGTGRLWAVLIQLMHVHGEDAQLRVLRAAQEEVDTTLVAAISDH
jgi:la-related protein 1